MSGARVIEHWEEIPRRVGPAERFVVPDGVGVIYVVQYSKKNCPGPGAVSEQLRMLADEFHARDPNAIVLSLPADWAFRVLHIDDPGSKEDAS